MHAYNGNVKGKKKRDTRKKMRKIIKDSKLQAETIDAVKAEEERRQMGR